MLIKEDTEYDGISTYIESDLLPQHGNEALLLKLYVESKNCKTILKYVRKDLGFNSKNNLNDINIHIIYILGNPEEEYIKNSDLNPNINSLVLAELFSDQFSAFIVDFRELILDKNVGNFSTDMLNIFLIKLSEKIKQLKGDNLNSNFKNDITVFFSDNSIDVPSELLPIIDMTFGTDYALLYKIAKEKMCSLVRERKPI